MNYLNGGRWTMVAEFIEIESGKRNDRPELQKALAACKKQKAMLVIVKLSRCAALPGRWLRGVSLRLVGAQGHRCR
jgi:DNA invertase Pin-like site-specific DNA recombinase